MAEHDRLADLSELARVGEDYAAPIPVEQVRRRAQRRRTRRRAGLVTAVVVAVVVAGGAVVSTTGLRADRGPEPVGTPSSAVPAPTSSAPSTSPSEDSPADPPAARELRLANLPTESDLEWHGPGDWKTTDTYSGIGGQDISRCFAPGPASLPAFRRDFRLADSAGDRAGAVVLEFADAEAAETAYATIVRAGTRLPDPTGETGSPADQRRATGCRSSCPAAAAQFIQTSTEVLDEPTSDDTHFGDYGVVRIGDRLAVVAMDTVGLDSNWSYAENDPTGLAMHPMFRTLPKVAARLSGAPATRPTTTPATKLTRANLLTSDDVPRRDPVLVTDPGDGRAVAEASVCVPSGAWDSLGATQVLTRNFRYDWPDDPAARNGEPGTPGYTPLYERPEFYTAALQFADEAAAVRAQKRYRAWLSDCAKELERRNFTLTNRDQTKTTWIDVPATASGGRVVGKFAVLPTYELPGLEAGPDGFTGAYFERVGLTRLGNRLMITVSLAWGIEHHYSDQPGGDQDTGFPADPQFALVQAAAKRLAR